MITYYWNNRQTQISKSALKKKVGEEWGKVERQAKSLGMIHNHWVLVYTKQGSVIAENNTLIGWSQFLSAILIVAAFLLTLGNNSFAMPQLLKPILFYTGLTCMLTSGVIVGLGFKNDERHIVDMGAPLMWAGIISMGASFFW